MKLFLIKFIGLKQLFLLWMMFSYNIDHVEYINKLTGSLVALCWTHFLELKTQTTTCTYTS